MCALSIRISITQSLLASGLVSATITDTIPRDLVYLYPSISTLTDFVSSATFLNGKARPPTEDQCLPSSFDEDLRWQAVLQNNDTLVELSPNQSTEKPPLIILHSTFQEHLVTKTSFNDQWPSGGTGRLTSYRPLLRYHGSVWGIQMTEVTPTGSLDDMAAFYYQQIKVRALSPEIRLVYSQYDYASAGKMATGSIPNRLLQWIFDYLNGSRRHG